MRFNEFVRDYFTFSRGERKGLIILLFIIFLLAVANKMIFYFEKPATLNEALFDSAKQELVQLKDTVNSGTENAVNAGFSDAAFSTTTKNNDAAHSKVKAAESTQLFSFDPNTCSDEDFRRLGFSDKQTVAIRKYMRSGVVFRNREDFFKIRIITEKQKEALSPFVEIPEPAALALTAKENRKSVETELNAADSLSLEQLPGIGKILSKRIVRYRDLLGGFYAVAQLKEVYGLPEETFSKIEKSIRVDPSAIHKIDLNFGDFSELSRHPYLKKNLAEKIIKFRSRFGNISDPLVLKENLILTDEEYLRIKPYF